MTQADLMTRRVVAVVGYPGAESLDISSVTATFDAATRLGADPGHSVRLLSPGGADVPCQDGLTRRGELALERVAGPLDTLLVSGGLGHDSAAAEAQMSVSTAPPAPDSRPVRALVAHVGANLDGDLSTRALARAVGVSERHLSRLCLTHLGATQGRFVRRARTEAAALLATTALPVAGVAARCGFGSAEALRQAFEARYGVSPWAYRAAYSGAHSGARRHPIESRW